MKVDTAIELLLALLSQAGKISSLIDTARAAGRDEFTMEEWATLLAADDVARLRLAKAIIAASSRPPGD